MSTGQFQSGDKVFAKVRGYSPWPAVITGYADKTPKRMKFNVCFYGTKQTAVCRTKDICDYKENREKYTNSIKRRRYVDGMRELEIELDEKDRNPELFKGMKVSGEDSKLKSDDDSSLVIVEAGPSRNANVDGANASKRKRHAPVSASTSSSSEVAMSTPKPNLSTPDVVQQTGVLPGQVKANIGNVVRNSVVDPSTISCAEHLEIEMKLIDCCRRIKFSLTLMNANCVDCLTAMEDLLQLNFNALMLKKRPEVFEVARELRDYVGNLSSWNLSKDEEAEFKVNAIKIRAKASGIYNKIKRLFIIPVGMKFRAFFDEEMAKFRERTSGMNETQLYALTTEPQFEVTRIPV